MRSTIHTIIVAATLVTSTSVACARARSKVLAPAAHLAEARATHSTTPLGDGRLLVIGGFRKGPDGYSQLYSATTEIIDPARGTVTSGPSLLHARAGHVAVPLVDGRILVAGGWDEGGRVRTAEVYDPKRGAFAAVGDLAELRAGFPAVRLADGRVLVCGGGDRTALRTAEIFDPADDRFHPTGDMTTARFGHSATLLADGRVLVVGGSAGDDDVLASAEIYDPATGRFERAASLVTARYKHAAIRLDDGRVLVVGGSDTRDWKGKYASTEVYDPRADRFVAGPALTTPRFKLANALTSLGGGDGIAVAGGGSTVELVRPDRRSRTIADLGRASYYGTVSKVGDRLVIVGGYDDRVRTATAVWFVAVAPG